MLAATIWVHGSSAVAQAAPLSFHFEKPERICVEAQPGSRNKCDQLVDAKSLDKNTLRLLNRSDQLLPIFSQPAGAGHYLVFIARVPSRLPRSTGYCGAGYEDHVVALSYREKKIALQDDFLLQSCLKSVELDADGSGDIVDSISIDLEKHTIGFRWLTGPDEKAHHLALSNGKFQLH